MSLDDHTWAFQLAWGQSQSRWELEDNINKLRPDSWRISITQTNLNKFEIVPGLAFQLDLDASIFHWEDPWLQRHISVVSLVPMFRSYWDFEPISFFVGLGIGIAALDREIWMDRELGSHLQFEDKAEVGVRYKSHQIAIGISHFSNANLADINHGVNVVQLSYAHYF